MATSRPQHQTPWWKMFAPLRRFALPAMFILRSRHPAPVPPANLSRLLQRSWALPIRRQTLFIDSMARLLLLLQRRNLFHFCRQRRAPIPSLRSTSATRKFYPARHHRRLLWEAAPEILNSPLRLIPQPSKQARAPRFLFLLFP